jgi:hypothetical protein
VVREDVMHDLFCVIPSRTDSFLESLFASLERSEPGSLQRCIVVDNGLSHRPTGGIFIDCPLPFVFSQAINIGIDEAERRVPGCNFLLLNEDVDILTSMWHSSICRMAEMPESQAFGLLSLTVATGGCPNPEQRNPSAKTIVECSEQQTGITWIAPFLRQAAWREVGRMDEMFRGYGCEDTDYNQRVRQTKWKIGITNAASVAHGKGGLHCTSTYLRYNDAATFQAMCDANMALYKAKWGGK